MATSELYLRTSLDMVVGFLSNLQLISLKERVAFRFTIEVLQKQKSSRIIDSTGFILAGARGLEPGTNGFGDRYSTN